MPPTRRQTARSSHPRGRGVLRRLMDPSANIIANTSNTPTNNIPNATSSISQQAQDLSDWQTMQVGGQVKLCTIHSVVDLKIENGEELAFITYTDQSLEPEWEPVNNLRNAETLIERCRQRQADQADQEAHASYICSASKSVKFSTDLTNTREFSKLDILPITMRAPNPVQIDPKPKPILKAVQNVETDTSDPMQIDEGEALTENTILKEMDQMCMTNVIPLSYASQFVIKDVFLQGVLSIESDRNLHSYDALEIEQKWLKANDLEYEFEKLCLLGIVNSENICNKIGLIPTSERMFLIPYNISELKGQQNSMILPKQLVLGIEKMDDIEYFMSEVMLQAEGYYEVLPQICANNPKFTIYGNLQHSNNKAMIFCMETLGGKYFPIDTIGDMTLDLVLVEVTWLNQLNFMPNLIRLRHMKRCQFLVYGYDIKRLQSIKFNTYFVPGGLLAVSTKAITTESQAIERIFGTAHVNNGKWTILLNPRLKSHISEIMGRNYWARISSQEIKFFEEDLWKQSRQRHGNNEVGTLYWAVLISYRILALNENPPRHCVLIVHENEIQFPHSQIPGVEILTLKAFEKKFDQILQIYE
ncbi:494_t:CDS:10 [Scutellospora calospora]|uniref:494_t:CDS:1 n=1 Tax=Scutellospora calospora TaxID=85575 RepID=A0ACA9JTL4_9GLOM|nr:494_t:CDS:10 [Scutellospora calospora]